MNPVSPNEGIENAIATALAFLVRFCNQEGMFRYKIDLRRPAERQDGRYNLIRHAGVVCCLFTLGQKSGDQDILGAGRRGLEYGLRFRKEVELEGKASCAIFSDDIVKLGATGLTLAALTLKNSGDLSSEEVSIAEALGDYLISQQEESGRFRSLYFKDMKDFRPFESEYYPGEAILALSMLAHCTKAEKYRTAAVRGAQWLAEKYSRLPLDRIPADHWLLIAIEHLDSVERTSPALSQCAARIAEAILSSARCDQDRKYIFWDAKRSLCPAATRAEGLGAAVKLAFRHGFIKDACRLFWVLERAVAHILTCQVGERHIEIRPELEAMRGVFVKAPGSNRVRMDYIQHAVGAASVLLEARALLAPVTSV
jgi:hypothetical protein